MGLTSSVGPLLETTTLPEPVIVRRFGRHTGTARVTEAPDAATATGCLPTGHERKVPGTGTHSGTVGNAPSVYYTLGAPCTALR
jgi:hypothetical protein